MEKQKLYVVLSILEGVVKKVTTVRVARQLDGIRHLLLAVELKHWRSEKADEIKNDWMKSSRGVRNRLRKGALLSLKNNFQCYAPAKILRKYRLHEYKHVQTIGK